MHPSEQANSSSMYETVVLGLSVTAAAAFTLRVRHPPSIFRTASKTLSTALLSLFVHLHGGPVLLALALGFGSLGDAILALDEGDGAFLGGLSSFLVAHLVYIKAFYDVGGGQQKLLAENWRIALAVAMTIVAPGSSLILMPRVSPNLRAPITAYSAAIFAMFISVLGVDDKLAVIGALLFTTSDAILAADRFLLPRDSSHRVWMQYSVWVLYYTGQLLIARGIGMR